MMRTIIVAIFAVLLVLFWRWNDGFVVIDLGAGGQYDVALPIVVLVSFLLGFVPLWLLSVVQKLFWRRRIARLESSLEEMETELEQAKVELLRPPAASRMEATPAVSPQPAESIDEATAVLPVAESPVDKGGPDDDPDAVPDPYV